MKGNTQWQACPYRPADRLAEARLPWICRLAPQKDAVQVEWMDTGAPDAPHTLRWRPLYENDAWQEMPLTACNVSLGGLTPYREYEICVVRGGDEAARGPVRLFRAAPVPGTVINSLHPKDNTFAFSGQSLCSPSLIRLPSGTLLASMDVFAGRAPQNLSMLYRSEDRGATWRYVCDLYPLFWGNLFWHRDRLYMLGVSTEFGDLLIGASDDEGETWSVPTRLFLGSSTVGSGWEQATMPILRANGRLYFSTEYGHLPDVGISVVSVPQDADLLDAASWSATAPLPFDRHWPGTPAGGPRFLAEGNLLTDREGRIVNLLRIDLGACTPNHGKMVALSVDPNDPEAPAAFLRYVDMPSGSNSKTYILFDNVTDQYIAIGNVVTDERTPRQRNVVALLCSPDAYTWHTAHILLDYSAESPNEVGFQYPSFVIDGEDLLLQLRTALNGARNFHDANYSTFHIVPGFRKYVRSIYHADAT